MPKIRVAKQLRILDFDIENRPLSYLGSDFTTSEITAISASFEGERKVYSWFLGETEPVAMLEEFRQLYDAADIVTGHYILMHDLPIISGALAELGLPPLGPKLVSDTKVHLKAGKGVSKSQESLSDMFGLSAPKIHMTNPMWREANRLTPEGLALTRKRVEGDIKQHKQLRKRLLDQGLLGPPILWKP